MAASGQGGGAGIQEKIEQQESLINDIGLRFVTPNITSHIMSHIMSHIKSHV